MRTYNPEAALMKLCCDWLTAERIPYWRMNAGDRFGSYTSKRTGQTKGWKIKGQETGTADLLIERPRKCPLHLGPQCLCCRGARDAVWAELKAGRNDQSEAQQSFQQYVEGLGMTYRLIRSLEDLQKAVQEV